MFTKKNLLLALAPIPILLGSICAARWAREDPNRCAAPNEVLSGTHRLGRPPLETPSTARAIDLRARCAIVAGQLRATLRTGSVVVHSPLVIGGNLSPEMLDEWHDGTILPAMQALGRAYFRSRPADPITILLFGDEPAYRNYTRQQFGHQQLSIYGYYQPFSRTLVINLAAGSGTLVHELTHALMDVDHPSAPIWFNEGLASLHEHCTLRDEGGRPVIQPLVNWRLGILQAALADGRLPPLRTLMRKNDLRGPQEALDYAHARYFCFFLHRQGILPEFYAVLRDDVQRDPYGEEAVLRFFPDSTWPQIERVFRDWVSQQVSYTSYEPQNRAAS